jgi:hypothetical protein
MPRWPESHKSWCPSRSSIANDQETKATSNKRTTTDCSCSSSGGSVVKTTSTVAAGFETKSLETVAADFEVKPLETTATGFKVKPVKTVRVVLRPNHSQIVDLGFKAQPRNMRSSSPCTWCRPHTVTPDLSIVRPPSTRLVRSFLILCTRSATPVTILITARHAAPATCTQRDKQMRF